jgi:hypothetical protein
VLWLGLSESNGFKEATLRRRDYQLEERERIEKYRVVGENKVPKQYVPCPPSVYPQHRPR